ncbi:propionate catabolism operon regulatory protein PrpR [Pigmentiphaga sp. NML080357]|uniref:propionate catabolism operon regulatory protein PrpR n=1 Tax=Pigmentiphaga sp. NML080357 TaxID=2008675 RepID=UPI000B41A655|nr:propionate catabolism operon regulatory protein PrpR [Pigmentiphaga sp. NML080357]OVZ56360.1 propionate catabolism operon regulatory protein PrpR [Pigmentiphaga sp. NML080357]
MALATSLPLRTARPTIWAMGISRVSRAFAELTPAYAGQADFRIVDEGFETAARSINEAARQGLVDAVVAGGSNGAYLRQHVDVPVILIKVTGFDVMHALTTAKQLSNRLALVTHASTFPETEAFKQAFGLDFPSHSYVTTEDAAMQVKALKRAGMEVIVGPGLVSDLAEQQGLAGVFLYSSNSIRVALEDAIEAARLARIEQRRREYLNTVLSHLNEGVAAVDAEGRIQSLNPPMERLLGLRRDQVIGRPLEEEAPAISLDGPLRHGQKELETIQKVNDKVLILNRIPIQSGGELLGAVVTAQDAKAIQRVDRNLRTGATARPAGTRYGLEDLLGGSAAIQRVRELARLYAEVSSTVLIEGESGTGKEVLAQGMHRASPRRDFPFVAINCAAFPEPLLESELFGYEEGAFSGARKGGKTGLFEAAHNGTIFLDEIGDMPLALQVRLLRVLQERQVLPVGALEPVAVNVRVIAATHRDLHAMVRSGEFRRDLFYRINILRIAMPPLRERDGDVEELAEVLYARAQRRLGIARPVRLPAFVKALCASYAWPGNLREMENVLERVAVSHAGRKINRRELELELEITVPELYGATDGDAPSGSPDAPPLVSLDEVARASQAAHARRVLEACGGDRAAACRILGISPATLWRKLKDGRGGRTGSA